jgi:hypothetical protein
MLSWNKITCLIKTQIPRPKFQGPKSKTQDPKSKAQISRPKIQDSKSKTKIPSPKFQDPCLQQESKAYDLLLPGIWNLKFGT